MREGLTMARFMCEVNVDMCVEGRLKQEKIQGFWFVDGEVPSIRMQVKWKTFFLIESAKQQKNTLPVILS